MTLSNLFPKARFCPTLTVALSHASSVSKFPSAALYTVLVVSLSPSLMWLSSLMLISMLMAVPGLVSPAQSISASVLMLQC